MTPQETCLEALHALRTEIDIRRSYMSHARRSYMSHAPTVTIVNLLTESIADYEAAIKWVKEQK